MDALRALLEFSVDMKRFEVSKSSRVLCCAAVQNVEPTHVEPIRVNKTWSLLIEDIKNENEVFTFFWRDEFQVDSFTHLEGVYRDLLGEKMKYQMGVLEPQFDLFLLCVLMNQRELAFEFWKQCEVPVFVAICAVRLYICIRRVHEHN